MSDVLTSNWYGDGFTFFKAGEVAATCTADYLLNADRARKEYRKAVTVEQMEGSELLKDLPW